MSETPLTEVPDGPPKPIAPAESSPQHKLSFSQVDGRQVINLQFDTTGLDPTRRKYAALYLFLEGIHALARIKVPNDREIGLMATGLESELLRLNIQPT